MSTAVMKVLEEALKIDDVGAVKLAIARALGQLRQQPGVLDDLTLHRKLEAEIKRLKGPSAAAKAWGVHRQTVYAVQNGTRRCPPKILSAIGVKRIGPGRTQYREL